MVDLVDAEKQRDLILAQTGLSSDIVRNEEILSIVVNQGGRTVYTSGSFSLTETPDRVFVPSHYGASFTVYLVYSRYVFGQHPVRVYKRIRYRAHPAKAGTFLSFPRWNLDLPLFLPTARQSARVRQRRARVRTFVPKKASRPSPEIRTETLPTMRVRTGLGVDQYALFSYNSFSRTWSGTTTPGFGKTKRKHLPVNPHSVLLIEQEQPGFYKAAGPANGTIETWWLTSFCDWASLGLPRSPSHSESVYNQAIKRLIQRMETGIDGNVAQDVVQIEQTVRTITDSATRISDAIRSVRNRNIVDAVEVLWQGRTPKFGSGRQPKRGASLANNWLALQYGWKPLLQDIKGSMEALARYNLEDYSVRAVTASAKVTNVEVVDIFDDYNAQVKIGTIFHAYLSQCRIGVKYRVNNHLRAFLSQTGFTNPVNLAWEVLPYSFVVDWFIPIGPYLETLTAYEGLDFYEGFATQFSRWNTFGAVDFNGLVASGTEHRLYKGQYSSRAVRLNRSKLSSFPRVQFPTSLKNPLSVDHALNAIALMRAGFRG